jgi:hypothetical protein
MPISPHAWAEAFGASRAYEAYRQLSAADGTVAGLRDATDGRPPATDPHRFWVDYSALQKLAVPEVIQGLERFLEGEDLDTANGFRRTVFGGLEPIQR